MHIYAFMQSIWHKILKNENCEMGFFFFFEMVFFLIPMFTSYPKQSSTIPMSMKYFLYSYIWLLLLTDMKILFHKCLCSKRKKTNCTFDKHIEILRLDCSKTTKLFPVIQLFPSDFW